VAQVGDVRDLVEAGNAFGGIDILVNSATLFTRSLFMLPSSTLLAALGELIRSSPSESVNILLLTLDHIHQHQEVRIGHYDKKWLA
jgi:hypothetical protein